MLSQNIQKMIGEAMKAHDAVRLSTLRMLSSAFNYEKINLQHDLTEEEEMAVIRKQAKERKDSIDAYTKAGREDMAEVEKAEQIILQEFLPPEMDNSELERIVDQAILAQGAKTIAELGRVIAAVKVVTGPSVEGGKIAELVKAKLNASDI